MGNYKIQPGVDKIITAKGMSPKNILRNSEQG